MGFCASEVHVANTVLSASNKASDCRLRGAVPPVALATIGAGQDVEKRWAVGWGVLRDFCAI